MDFYISAELLLSLREITMLKEETQETLEMGTAMDNIQDTADTFDDVRAEETPLSSDKNEAESVADVSFPLEEDQNLIIASDSVSILEATYDSSSLPAEKQPADENSAESVEQQPNKKPRKRKTKATEAAHLTAAAEDSVLSDPQPAKAAAKRGRKKQTKAGEDGSAAKTSDDAHDSELAAKEAPAPDQVDVANKEAKTGSRQQDDSTETVLLKTAAETSDKEENQTEEKFVEEKQAAGSAIQPRFHEIYLIDFENVGCDGLDGAAQLTKDDQVIIFYSSKSNRLSFEMHLMIVNSQANFSYYGVTVGGKNALDHQLSTYLGYLIGVDAADKYIIVSKDNGYRFLTDFWAAKRKVAVSCVGYVGQALKKTKTMMAVSSDTAEAMATSAMMMNDCSSHSRSRKHKAESKERKTENTQPLAASSALAARPVAALVSAKSNDDAAEQKGVNSEAEKLFTEYGFMLNPEVLDLIAHGDKQEVYLQFVKQLGQENGLELYYKAKKVLWH